MKLVVGLGNIGREYEHTRHNIGFMVVDELAKRFDLRWRKERLASVCECYSPCKFLLVKPETYMNLSGVAVSAISKYYKIDISDLAVVQDDLALPCAKLRVRRAGSAGGHNGILSIAEHLGSNDFARFKIGIGSPAYKEKSVVKHVLERFSGDEVGLIDEALTKTADAIEYWLSNGIEKTMNKFNG